jgi:hypothetical protein
MLFFFTSNISNPSFYKISRFQSEIGKYFQANYDLEIPNRLISQFGNRYVGLRNVHMTNFAMSRLWNSITPAFPYYLMNFQFHAAMSVYRETNLDKTLFYVANI